MNYNRLRVTATAMAFILEVFIGLVRVICSLFSLSLLNKGTEIFVTFLESNF